MPIIPFPVVPTATEGFGPCQTWDPIWCVELPTSSVEISGNALRMATEILWARSGMRYDECTFTIRPCSDACWNNGGWPYGDFWWQLGTFYPQPALIQGNWYNLTCGSCSGTCSCTNISEVTLPGPVTAINQVKIDGKILGPSKYRLDDWRKLVRIGDIWPMCNDLNKADTEVGTWSVTLTYGQPVPTSGRMAVGELAYQLILACLGDECCKLPYMVQQVARQGVTIKYPDISDLFGMDRGGRVTNRLGLQFCDMFLDAVNPYGLRQASQVYSIDAAPPRIAGSFM